ncbi:MAG: hypothetical protein IJ705_02875, partial [Oscillospiraceae bacterium]|nr:hypothetical protein [Oscillospiraceae bacterium]
MPDENGIARLARITSRNWQLDSDSSAISQVRIVNLHSFFYYRILALHRDGGDCIGGRSERNRILIRVISSELRSQFQSYVDGDIFALVHIATVVCKNFLGKRGNIYLVGINRVFRRYSAGYNSSTDCRRCC